MHVEIHIVNGVTTAHLLLNSEELSNLNTDLSQLLGETQTTKQLKEQLSNLFSGLIA